MTLAVDASTPALAPANAAGTTVTSNSFSPPANSLLVVTYPSNYGYTITSITDSLASHLTYRQLVGAVLDEDCEIWVADCPSAQTNMTVTVTVSSTLPANESTLGVIVLTGAAPAASQTGATNHNSQYSGAPSCGVTTTANGSLVIGVVNFPNSTATPTVASGQTTTFGSHALFQTTGAGSGWCQTTTSPTATSGTLVTISDTAPTGDHGIVAAEILAGSGGSSATVNAKSAQIRLRAYGASVSTVTPVNKTVQAPSAQLRLRSASPAVLSTSSALSGPSAQIRLRSGSPTVTTGSSATVTARSAQIRLRAAKPSLTTTSGKSIQAPSAQLRVRAGHPSLASTSTIHGTSAQIRLRSYGVTAFASAAIPEICNPTALILTSNASTLTLTGRDTTMALTGPADTTLAVDSDDASTLTLTIC